jgi:choice-of-anchor A domain-containing protein
VPTIDLNLSDSQQYSQISVRGRRSASLSGALRLALALILGASASFAESLDVAQGYNLFAFNNINVSTDVGGAVALGGQLQSATSIGSQLSVSSAFPSLVADGTNNSNVIANGVGTIDINKGSAFLSGYSSSQPANATFNQGGAGYMTGSDPVSGGIAGSQSSFVNLATTLASTTPNATVTNGTINISGQGAGTYVVNLNNLSSLTAIYYNAGSQTLIINVSGSTTWSGVNLTINGSQQSNTSTAASTILFNFGTASAVALDSGFFGSILAPDATVSGAGTIVDGEVIANNINGLGEVESQSIFNGNLPGGAAPEPGTLTLMGAVLVGFGVFGRRRLSLKAQPIGK